MQKRILFLLLILGLSVVYSLISLDISEDSKLFENKPSNANKELSDKARTSNSLAQESAKNTNSDKQVSHLKSQVSLDAILPYEFDLVGISDIANNEQAILIKFENDLYKYEVNEFLLNTDMQLVKISELQISILFDQVMYKKELIPPNLLSKITDDGDKSYSQLVNMSAKEISSRPRIIEHLFELTPTPYIADGKLASPGINPALFVQAGFKPDDLLKTINGKSVTIESEFDEIKKELKTAQTLEFLVMRKGRLITLYLDIPSETLELVRD